MRAIRQTAEMFALAGISLEDVEYLLPELDIEDMPDIFWYCTVKIVNDYHNYLDSLI